MIHDTGRIGKHRPQIAPHHIVTLATLALGHAATHWGKASFYILLPLIAVEADLSNSQAGLLVSLMYISQTSGNVIGGPLVDLTGHIRLIQFAALCCGGAGMLALWQSDSIILLAFATICIGVGNDLWHPPSLVRLTRSFPDHRGFALSIHAVGGSLGDLTAPLLTGMLISLLQWRLTALVIAVPICLIAPMLLVRGKHSPSTAMQKKSVGFDLRQIYDTFRDRFVLGICLIGGIRSMTLNGALLFIPLWLYRDLSFSPVMIGVTVTLLHLGAIAALPVCGRMADRYGPRLVIVMALCLACSALLVLSTTRSEWIIAPCVFLIGAGLSGFRPAIQEWVIDSAQSGASGSSISLLFGTQSTLSAMMTPLGGWLADLYGIPATLLALAAFAGLACVLTLCMRGRGH